MKLLLVICLAVTVPVVLTIVDPANRQDDLSNLDGRRRLQELMLKFKNNSGKDLKKVIDLKIVSDDSNESDASPEDKSDGSPENKTNVSSNDKSVASPKDKSDASPKDKSDVSPEDKSDESPENKKDESLEDKSDVSPENKSDTSPEDKTSVSPKEKSDELPSDKSDESPIDKSDESPKDKSDESPKDKSDASPEKVSEEKNSHETNIDGNRNREDRQGHDCKKEGGIKEVKYPWQIEKVSTVSEEEYDEPVLKVPEPSIEALLNYLELYLTLLSEEVVPVNNIKVNLNNNKEKQSIRLRNQTSHLPKIEKKIQTLLDEDDDEDFEMYDEEGRDLMDWEDVIKNQIEETIFKRFPTQIASYYEH